MATRLLLHLCSLSNKTPCVYFMEPQATAIQKILGQDSTRKRRENRLEKQRQDIEDVSMFTNVYDLCILNFFVKIFLVFVISS